MTKSTKKNKSVARVTFYKTPQDRKQVNDHEYIRYAINTSNTGGSSRISANKSTIRTQVAFSAHSVNDNTPSASDDMNVDLDIPLDEAYVHYLENLNPTDEDPSVLKQKDDSENKGVGDESLHEFIPQAERFLEEMIGTDGRGELFAEICPTCQERAAAYECKDCHGRELYCAQCTVDAHRTNYLHRIQRWNGLWFQKTTLKELGLRIQLGHKNGEACIRPERVRNDDFTIIDIDGIHDVALDFCGCSNITHDHTSQLLRWRLFPATIERPKTAATFRSLEYLEILSYESKLSVFEFFQTLARCTDNTGVEPPKDRYRALLRIIHEWRFLKLMKRAGRGHDPTGIKGTEEGGCAVLCPACPQPDKNMRPGWETDGSPRYLHSLFVAMDANFRLKRKNVSSNQADPGLNLGCAYFVEDTKYKAHLEMFKNEKEPKSTCSRHDTINLSEKSCLGHAATGIGACVCSRHDMKRPKSVGDLQRGERYCNMDYIFHTTLKDAANLTNFCISYDIACQWSINLKARMEKYDPSFFIHDSTKYIRYLVPKFHLPAHIARCRADFSFNLTAGTGRTEGEAPERGWVFLNSLATSTREMGPGTRCDTLDCHIGDENWKKVTGMGASLFRKMKAAAKDMAEYTISHNDLSSTIPSATYDRWESEVTAWENDKTQPNPYQITATGPTQAAVLKQLADDEAADIANARDMSLDDKITPSVLISLGLTLESEQRRLKTSGKGLWDHALDRQRTKHQYQLNTLQRKIDAWISYQQLYLPGLVKLRSSLDAKRADPSAEIKPYDIALWLPSQINGLISVPAHLRRIEWKLRYSQAHEALEEVRTQLQIRAHMYNSKDRFTRGQSANTRAWSTIKGTTAKIDAAALEYNVAYNALTALAPALFEFTWQEELLPLKPEDIRDLSEGKSTRNGKQSEGRKTASWIWKKVAVDEDNDEFLTDRLRSEWCHSRARAQRFTEEVSLLAEEIGRVSRYLEWKADFWTKLAEPDSWGNQQRHVLQTEGRAAYAHKQAHMFLQIKNSFENMWKPLPAHIQRMLSIIDDPKLAAPGEFDERPRGKSKYNSSRRT